MNCLIFIRLKHQLYFNVIVFEERAFEMSEEFCDCFFSIHIQCFNDFFNESLSILSVMLKSVYHVKMLRINY